MIVRVIATNVLIKREENGSFLKRSVTPNSVQKDVGLSAVFSSVRDREQKLMKKGLCRPFSRISKMPLLAYTLVCNSEEYYGHLERFPQLWNRFNRGEVPFRPDKARTITCTSLVTH